MQMPCVRAERDFAGRFHTIRAEGQGTGGVVMCRTALGGGDVVRPRQLRPLGSAAEARMLVHAHEVAIDPVVCEELAGIAGCVV
jgi:hypothetical protein